MASGKDPLARCILAHPICNQSRDMKAEVLSCASYLLRMG